MKIFRWLRLRRVWVPLAAILVTLVAISFVHTPADGSTHIAFSDVISAAKAGKLQSVDVHGDRLDVKLYGDSANYSSDVGSSTDIARALQDAPAVASPANTDPVVVLRFHGTSAAWAPWVAWVLQIVVSGLVVYFAVLLGTRAAQRK